MDQALVHGPNEGDHAPSDWSAWNTLLLCSNRAKKPINSFCTWFSPFSVPVSMIERVLLWAIPTAREHWSRSYLSALLTLHFSFVGHSAQDAGQHKGWKAVLACVQLVWIVLVVSGRHGKTPAGMLFVICVNRAMGVKIEGKSSKPKHSGTSPCVCESFVNPLLCTLWLCARVKCCCARGTSTEREQHLPASLERETYYVHVYGNLTTGRRRKGATSEMQYQEGTQESRFRLVP